MRNSAPPSESIRAAAGGQRRADAAPQFSQKFRDLVEQTSRSDWDDDGAPPIPKGRFEETILSAYHRAVKAFPHLSDPHPSASGDGTLFLRWASGESVFDAEFSTTNEITWSRRMPDGGVSSGEVASIEVLIEQMKVSFAN